MDTFESMHPTPPAATLKSLAAHFGDGVLNVASYLIDDPRFPIWSGSSKPHQHHYGDGGLARHTLEVVELCFSSRDYFVDITRKDRHQIDAVELFLAALFHDAGKIYDYRRVQTCNVAEPQEISFKSKNQWEGTSHKRLIHHISRSATMWTEAVGTSMDWPLRDKYYEPVLHAILSHHGRRDAGSPVAPKSRVAWLVHLCDNISARMCDADTLDIVHPN